MAAIKIEQGVDTINIFTSVIRDHRRESSGRTINHNPKIEGSNPGEGTMTIMVLAVS
jgi:hypothetical protein